MTDLEDDRGSTFLGPARSPGAEQLAAGDRDGLGYVMNVSRLWGHGPELHAGIFAVVQQAVDIAGLTLRERGILITSLASSMGDAYCSLAWGGKLAGEADPALAASVLRGDHSGLDDKERALARWARQLTSDPNGTTAADLEPLRTAGYDDARILAISTFVALRAAFSSINDALGAAPDAELADRLPPEVLAAVEWGRPIAPAPAT